MKDLYKDLTKAHSIYTGKVDHVKQEIYDKVEFEFDILFQQSDGFIILHVDEDRNAPLDKCLDIIKKKGILTYEDYLKESI